MAEQDPVIVSMPRAVVVAEHLMIINCFSSLEEVVAVEAVEAAAKEAEEPVAAVVVVVAPSRLLHWVQ